MLVDGKNADLLDLRCVWWKRLPSRMCVCHANIVQMLLSHKAKTTMLKSRDASATALHLCVKYGNFSERFPNNVKVIRILVDAGIPLNREIGPRRLRTSKAAPNALSPEEFEGEAEPEVHGNGAWSSQRVLMAFKV